MTLRIWGRKTSTNVQKVLWLCAELGLSYERIDLGGPFGGLDDPAYRAKNPNGLIPTIEDNGFILWESHAILRYLAADHPQSGLMPDDRHARAIMDQWLDWQMVALGLSLRDLFMKLHRPGAVAPTVEEIAAAADYAASKFLIVEGRLAQSPYVAGDAFSLADIAVGISVHRWLKLAVDRPVVPAILAWYDRVSMRDAFGKIATIPLK